MFILGVTSSDPLDLLLVVLGLACLIKSGGLWYRKPWALTGAKGVLYLGAGIFVILVALSVISEVLSWFDIVEGSPIPFLAEIIWRVIVLAVFGGMLKWLDSEKIQTYFKKKKTGVESPTIKKMSDSLQISKDEQPSEIIQPSQSNLNQTVKFLTYKNPALGIRIQYPSDWQIEDPKDNKVTFTQEKNVVSFDVTTENIDSSSSNKDTTIVSEKIKRSSEDSKVYNLIESGPTTISSDNIQAYKLLYTFTKEEGIGGAQINKILTIWVIKEDRVYTLAYIAELDKFSTFFPTAQKMIDSFAIISHLEQI